MNYDEWKAANPGALEFGTLDERTLQGARTSIPDHSADCMSYGLRAVVSDQRKRIAFSRMPGNRLRHPPANTKEHGWNQPASGRILGDG